MIGPIVIEPSSSEFEAIESSRYLHFPKPLETILYESYTGKVNNRISKKIEKTE